MYNFRYHLVTIISIFAALALGLLFGVAITGSDLVRDASSNLAQSLGEQFDELNATNKALADQIEAEQFFSDELLTAWQADRLKGRTIAILTRASSSGSGLEQELSAYVTQSGGIPVIVRIDPAVGFGTGDEQEVAQLKKLLPEVEGEDYEVTLARALAEEWSFSVSPTDSPTMVPTLFEADYPLTIHLVERKLLTVMPAYQPLLDAAATPGSPEAQALASEAQRAAYELAQQLHRPYGVNGIIDTAIFIQPDGGQPRADPVALQLAQSFDALGQAGELPWLSLDTKVTRETTATEGAGDPTAAGADDDAEGTSGTSTGGEGAGAAGTGQPDDATSAEATGQPDATLSYYALLVQQGDWVDALLAASKDSNLPCALASLDPTGHYTVIALLTGAAKGTYGLSKSAIPAFPSIPLDVSGKAPWE
ncbi:MAG: copper transporter [Coriobacteriales bacterium]|jgi:hypothetical protein|nr:copper transporter [Coriobacteriales bacterium]